MGQGHYSFMMFTVCFVSIEEAELPVIIQFVWLPCYYSQKLSVLIILSTLT